MVQKKKLNIKPVILRKILGGFVWLRIILHVENTYLKFLIYKYSKRTLLAIELLVNNQLFNLFMYRLLNKYFLP